DAGDELVARRVRLQRQRQVVQRGQQLAGQLRHPPLLGAGRLLGRPLAVVLEVGLRPLGQREVLVALAGLGHQLVDVVRQRVGVGRGLGPLLLEPGGGSLGLGGSGGGLVALGHEPLPSSTTSASTTSSSSESASPAAVPEPFGAPPAPPSPPAAAASCWARSYIACETAWKAVCSASVLARISAVSSEVMTSRASLIAASIRWRESASTLSPSSPSWRSAW